MADPALTFRCPRSAIWLPRILAASVMVSALLAGYRLGSRKSGGWIEAIGPWFGLLGAVAALWLVRRGGEVRRRVVIGLDGLTFREPRGERALRWAEIRELCWQAPFVARGFWLGALGIVDRGGRTWRVPAMIHDGPCLLRQLLQRSERNDLRSWAEARSLELRLRRGSLGTIYGYGVAGLIIVAGVVFYLQ